MELLVYFVLQVSLRIYQVKKYYSLVEQFFGLFYFSNTYFKFDSCLIHEYILIIYHPLWKKNHNKLLLLFASVQFHVYFLSLFVWHMFEPISWSASKYFKELIQCEICSSIYRYINDDAFLLRCRKICVFSSSLDSTS